MASKATDEDSVLILLSTKSPTSITHPERRILLTQSRPTLKIGRSSNRSALALTPTLDNGYFDSPVMSREHAEIEADIPHQVVRIRDAGSMHGTYVNDEPLDTEVARLLASGDEIKFGSSVYRNQKTFQPATVTVGIDFRTGGQEDHSPSRVFTVPDDCSTDENEPLDDNTPRKIPTFMSDEDKDTNPWEEEMGHERDSLRQIDGIIEIDSSSESESDNLQHDGTFVLSGDGDHTYANDLTVDFDDDDVSISLTDEEDTSSAPASPVESIDLDDPDLEDNDGARSPSWNSVSTDPQSEHVAGQPPSSGHNSEDEQGVFLYDTESEEMDDIDAVDVDFDPYQQTIIHQGPFRQTETALPVQTVPYGQPTLPSLNTAVLAHSNFDYHHLAPVMQPVPRLPSPSDAVLPVGRRHHGSKDDCAITVESLGRKSGKPDFFEAREQNKIRISSSAPSPWRVANIPKETLPPLTGGIAQFPTSSSAGAELSSASVLDMEPRPEAAPQHDVHTSPLSLPLAAQDVERKPGSLCTPEKSVPMPPKEALSTARLGEPSDTGVKPREAVDPAWTAASADELFRMKQSAQGWTNRAVSRVLDSPEASIGTELSEPRKDTAKGKRKAAEISETADPWETIWHEQSAADQQHASSSPVPAQPEIDMDLSRLSFHNTLEEVPTAVRPTKMRKIAERVGYAALGGATVGAMVLTSLIYTAPNFA